MKNGECWYIDADRPHHVTNESSSDRIHIVVDCGRNAGSDDVFRAAGYDFDGEARRGVDPHTRRQMIEELRRMNTPVAPQLIEKLTPPASRAT